MPFARHPMSRLSLLAALAAGLGSSAAFAADPNLARNLAATCANCHGTDGHAQPGALHVLARQD